jgi:MFS family permease
VATNPDDAFRLRAIALHAYGPSALSSIGIGAVLPVLALRAREVGASVQLAALVLALFGIGPLLASLPAGALVDRIGERRALVGAGLMDALATAAAALARSVPVFAAAIFVSGAAWTVFLLARQGYMIDAVPPDRRARALSLLGGMHRVGLLIGPLVGAALIGPFGLSGPFWASVGTSLAAAALSWTMPDLDAARRAEAGDPLSVRAVMVEHRGVLLTLGVVVLLISATRAVRVTLLPLWADHIGLGAQQNSLVFGLAAAVELALVHPWAG